MKQIDKLSAIAHAQGRQYKAMLSEAMMLIDAALSSSEQPYVSFSCGKDSTVLADMVLSVCPTAPLRFLSSGETRLLHNVDDIIAYFSSRGATIEETLIDRVFSEEWKDKGWNESRKSGVGDIHKLNATGDCSFIGLRAQESPVRRISLYGCKTEGLPRFLYRMKEGRLRACPLARWRDEDIAAHIVSRELPMMAAYHEEGIKTRTTGRLTGTAVRMGTLRRLRDYHREQYNAIIARWPELAAIY